MTKTVNPWKIKCFLKTYSNKLSVDDVFYLQTTIFMDKKSSRLLSNTDGWMTDGIGIDLA